MKPTVGRIVHYTTGRGGVCEAAIVEAVLRDRPAPDGSPITGRLNLTVCGFYGDTRRALDMPEVDPAYPAGAPDIEGWHWPERDA